MSSVATWSARATPCALAASVVMLTLGTISLVFAALRLSLGEDAWTGLSEFFGKLSFQIDAAPHGGIVRALPATGAVLVVLMAAVVLTYRIARDLRRSASILSWNSAQQCFHIDCTSARWHLEHVWRASAWVALTLSSEGSPTAEHAGSGSFMSAYFTQGCRRRCHLVIWKSGVEPQSWSELALLIQRGLAGREQKNKEKFHGPA